MKAQHDSNRDDIRTMQAAQADLSRFAPIYERYGERIYQYCLRRVESAEAAEDLTSLIFTRAMTGVQHFEGGSVVAWLFRIAHNTVANHYRARRPQVSFERDDIDVPDETTPPPIEHMVADEQEHMLQTLIDSLPDEQRELLLLKLTGALTAEDMGKVVGKSAGAVRVELHRIIERLRTAYEQEARI